MVYHNKPFLLTYSNQLSHRNNAVLPTQDTGRPYWIPTMHLLVQFVHNEPFVLRRTSFKVSEELYCLLIQIKTKAENLRECQHRIYVSLRSIKKNITYLPHFHHPRWLWFGTLHRGLRFICVILTKTFVLIV